MFNLAPLRFETLERDLFPKVFSADFFSRPFAAFKTDIMETGKEYIVEAELPGYAKEEIKVEFKEGELTITANKSESIEEKNKNYLRKERRFDQMARTFVFDNVNSDEIKAEFKDGVLKLILPKLETAEAQVKRININ